MQFWLSYRWWISTYRALRVIDHEKVCWPYSEVWFLTSHSICILQICKTIHNLVQEHEHWSITSQSKYSAKLQRLAREKMNVPGTPCSTDPHFPLSLRVCGARRRLRARSNQENGSALLAGAISLFPSHCILGHCTSPTTRAIGFTTWNWPRRIQLVQYHLSLSVFQDNQLKEVTFLLASSRYVWHL